VEEPTAIACRRQEKKKKKEKREGGSRFGWRGGRKEKGEGRPIPLVCQKKERKRGEAAITKGEKPLLSKKREKEKKAVPLFLFPTR